MTPPFRQLDAAMQSLPLVAILRGMTRRRGAGRGRMR
jgi:hypothetical protein